MTAIQSLIEVACLAKERIVDADMHDEISGNFAFFEGIVAGLMPRHAGEYAVIRDRTVVDFFARPGEALQAAAAQFDDGRFSIQRVIDRPLDLGFLSYGAGDGTTD